jgi:glycosyltransferase involved in cell wall biosynthesis
MRLLIDSVAMRSPGGVQLRDELAQSVEECAPENCDVVLLVTSGSCRLVNSDKLLVVTVDIPKGYLFGKWNWYNNILPKLANKHGADVLYSLSGILSNTNKLQRSFGVVNTTNNMTLFTPAILQGYPLISKARLRYMLLRHAIVKSIKMADAVVLHSQHALNMIMPYTGDISSKSFVTLTGVPRDIKFDRAAPPPHPYGGVPDYMYLSAIYSYKNHLRLTEAYRRALDENGSLPDLLIAGLPAAKDYLKKIIATIKEFGLENKVKYIGVLDRKDIPAWIYYADINFFPSICETNSVVLAEILGLGGVLACSNISSMPEVASYAAELFDPYSIDSMKHIIIELSRNHKRCEELRRLALKRATELSWDACGKTIWQAAMKAQAAFLDRKERLKCF